MNNNQAKPTKGPWKLAFSGNASSPEWLVYYKDLQDSHYMICDVNQDIVVGDHTQNAKLIAEAGTVFHETGLTPRELNRQRNELKELVLAITEGVEINKEFVKACKAAITNAEKRGE